MPALPATCKRCLTIFPSGFFVNNVRNFQSSGNETKCPKCEGTAVVVAGKFNFHDNVAEVISAPYRSILALDRAGFLLKFNPIDEFNFALSGIYGVYLDSTSGFRVLVREFEKHIPKTLEMLNKTDPQIAHENYLMETDYFYGKGEDPNKPGYKILHRRTQGQYRLQNSPNGLNHQVIGNMTIVSIYQFWEDHYREKIADSLNKGKNDLKIPIFGDIRIFRNYIIHNNSVCGNKVRKCEELKWFSPGDILFIDSDKIDLIIGRIQESLAPLRKELTGE